MKHKGRTFLILTIVLVLFLVPLGMILTKVKAFQGTMQGWIILTILLAIAFIYYLIMNYIIFHRGKKK